MKITKSQLKQIIREELNEGGYAGHAVDLFGDATGGLVADGDPGGVRRPVARS